MEMRIGTEMGETKTVDKMRLREEKDIAEKKRERRSRDEGRQDGDVYGDGDGVDGDSVAEDDELLSRAKKESSKRISVFPDSFNDFPNKRLRKAA